MSVQLREVNASIVSLEKDLKAREAKLEDLMKKRCVIVCQGFYEWLKKGPGGKEKVPHFVKRKDGELMLFAGLWDCVSYEGEFVDKYWVDYLVVRLTCCGRGG